MRRILSLVFCLTLVGPAAVLATTFVMVPDEALVDQSPLIIEGTVVAQSLKETASGLATVYQVEPTEMLKGTPDGSTLSVRVPGGIRPNGTGYKIWGAPAFNVGEEVLLFLRARQDGTYDLVQLMLGTFRKKGGPGGEEVFRREFGAARQVTLEGRTVPPGRDPDRKAEEFKTWIRARSRGMSASGKYIVEPQTGTIDGDEELQSVTAPYAFFTFNGLKMRWFTFDGGGSAPWRANFMGLSGTGTSATEVQAAVDAWTDDPGSKVNYNYAGTTTATNGFTGGFDGINSILFEDPNNFIDGSFNCVSGGVVAEGGPWFGGTQSFGGENFNIISGADVIVQDGASCYLVSSGGTNGEETYAHELGHTLGIGHSAVTEALMYFLAHADGRGAQLHPDDQAILAILYPNDGGGGGNTPPTISDIANRTINEDGTTGVINFTVGDAETAAGSLSVSGTSSNQALVTNANITFGGSGGNRTVTVTPNSDQSGSATITVTVSDGQASASDTFLLTVNPVNDPPTIANIPNQTTAANTPKGPINFNVNDIDTAAGSLTLSGTSSNPTLVPNANITFGGSGTIRSVTLTPAPDQSGTTIITVTVSDGEFTDSDSFTLTVTAPPPPAEPPVISSISNQTIDEDDSTGPVAFTVSDPDTPAGSLNLSGTSSNQGLVPNGNITFGGSGENRTVTVTPAANQSGSATITVTVSDGSDTDSTQFIVTVQSVPDAPTISDIPDQQIAVDTSTGPIPFTISDPDTSVSALQLTAISFNTTLVPNANIVFGGSGGSRSVTVTPAPGETGVATIRVTVSDGNGSDLAQFDVEVSAPDPGQELVLSYPDGDSGVLGVRRADGGNDASNLAPTNPMLGIDYVFQVKVTDPSGQPPSAVVLILNGVEYDMSLASGTPATGAVYTLTTQLGPKALHTFHFEARDGAGSLLDRLPGAAENNGPQVQLLNGANMVGIPKNLGQTSISAFTAFGTANAYRWISGGLSLNGDIDQGSFQRVDQSGSVQDGEAYFILRSGSPITLPNLGALPDNTGNTATYPLEPGWNLVSPPYEGRVRLGDIRVRQGVGSSIPWLQAVDSEWVDNAAYYFNGDDWGGTYGFLTDQDFLVSWLGYWIYLNRDDADYSLVFTRPGN